MNTARLSEAVRTLATAVDQASQAARDSGDLQVYQLLNDAAELARVLARLVDGKPTAKAFGAPGDWGYDTAIGRALAAPELDP